jgi:hypothetical protein
MASWMIHLRVAQGIYEKLNLIHKSEFAGNLRNQNCRGIVYEMPIL